MSLDLPQNGSASRVKSPEHVVDFWIPSKTLGIVHHLLQAPGHYFGKVRAQMVVQACIGCMKLNAKIHQFTSSTTIHPECLQILCRQLSRTSFYSNCKLCEGNNVLN